MARRWLPPLLLAVYALAFAWHALDRGVLGGDDHPGQLYRVAHVMALGPWPWLFNPGWWAGYAELQYYPPGFAYVGAALDVASFGMLDLGAAYQLLLWSTFVLPGVLVYLLVRRVEGDPWLALPPAFIALVLSGDSRSGVEEGLRWGLVAARLGWALVPALALVLLRWTEREAPPIAAPVALGAIVLTHPAHAPAGFVLLLLAAWLGPGSRRHRLGQAALLALGGVGLAAFWLVPLLAHLGMALPLAWGDASLAGVARRLASRPLLVCLVAASLLTLVASRASRSAERWLVWFAPAMAGVLALDALVAQPLGLMWLPADRLIDSVLLALVLGASVGLGQLRRRLPRVPAWALALAAIAGCMALAQPELSEPTLSLWPRPGAAQWPKQADIVAGARVDALWALLATAPSGRVLFVRSGVPLVHRSEWWRPHSHVTALTPLRAGRDIVNGTFTHPSPIAGLFYTGSSANRPIAELVEQRDGVTMFGRPLEDLGAHEFERLARALAISTVVALDEDEGRVNFVAGDPSFGAPHRIGPFLVFLSREPRALPRRTGLQQWRLAAASGDGEWVPTRLAYSPLWRASAGGQALAVRRDHLGLAEVRRPASASDEIVLTHAPGPAEEAGLLLTAATILSLGWWAAGRIRRTGRS